MSICYKPTANVKTSQGVETNDAGSQGKTGEERKIGWSDPPYVPDPHVLIYASTLSQLLFNIDIARSCQTKGRPLLPHVIRYSLLPSFLPNPAHISRRIIAPRGSLIGLRPPNPW